MEHVDMLDLKKPANEVPNNKELPLPSFIEKPVNEATDKDRCVDGRKDSKSNQGYQLLGGDAHPIVLKAIETNTSFNAESLKNGIETLKENNTPLGFHRGSHCDLDKGICDCGFCDKLINIISTAKDKRELITFRLKEIFDANKDLLPDFSIVENAYGKIMKYDLDKIEIKGNDIVKLAESDGANVENLEANHAERQAFVNLKTGVTLDTVKMNEQNEQAFNLDLPAAIDRASKLGVNNDFAAGASLILYAATEIVLVEDKGKPALPVVLHH